MWSRDWERRIHGESVLGGSSKITQRETRLVHALFNVQDRLADCSRLIAVAVGLERGMSLKQVTDLVDAACRSIDATLEYVYPTGWRQSWRRLGWFFRRWSPDDPLARMAREAHLAVALRDAMHVIKALGLEHRLYPQTLKLAELADLPLQYWPEIDSDDADTPNLGSPRSHPGPKP
jgi:hypothetical protein